MVSQVELLNISSEARNLPNVLPGVTIPLDNFLDGVHKLTLIQCLADDSRTLVAETPVDNMERHTRMGEGDVYRIIDHEKVALIADLARGESHYMDIQPTENGGVAPMCITHI